MKSRELKRKSFTYNGKRYWVYGVSDQERTRKMTQKIEALKRGELLVCSSMLFRVWAKQCVDTYKTNLTPKALSTYNFLLNSYILSDLGDMKIKDIKPMTCQKCLNKLEGKAKSTIAYTHQIMSFIFDKAVDNDLINKNPAKNITRPQGKAYQHRRALTPYEEDAFLKAVQKHPHKLLFLLIYGCGCRPSEARNVEGRDFIKRDGKQYLHIRGTKTVNADRTVPVPDVVVGALPETIEPFMKVCLTKDGKPISVQCLKRAWASLERLMNIEMGCKMYRNQLIPPYPLSPDVCPYCLRHTYCTNLQKNSIDIRTAQYLMGHADIQMTANIYTHTQIEYLDDIFDDVVKKPETRKNTNPDAEGRDNKVVSFG